MKLLVGLGNPGLKYAKNRHNLGFRIIEYITREYLGNSSITFKKKFNSLYNLIHVENTKILLVKPLTYMNSSGESILQWRKFYKISVSDIYIFYDDMDIKLGKIKLSCNCSNAGHNGVKSIVALNAITKLNKIRIGINRPTNMTMNEHVLSDFSSEEVDILSEQVFPVVLNITKDLINNDFDYLMNKYNCLK